MFQLTYAARELSRRLGRTILTALGLAAGVGLVIGIVGVSQGLDEAQGKVLAPLQSVGTDILVTRVAGAQTATVSPSPTATQQGEFGAPGGGGFSGGGGFFRGGGPGGDGGPGGGAFAALNEKDTAALLNENSNVVTDLSKLGKPGAKFTHDFFLSATLLSFPQQAVQQVASLPGVTGATPGLTQLANHQTGTVPEIVAELKTGGETITSTARPAAMTSSEQAAFRSCLEKSGAFGPPEPGRSGGGGAFEKCMPARFREYRMSVITPLRTIRQAIDPPSTDITSASYTAAGIDPASPDAGLVTRAQLTTGTWLRASNPNTVLANVAYAGKKSVKVGSKIAINGTDFTVVGLVNPTLTGNTADLYFPLATLQKLAGKTGRVTQVLVKAKDAGSVDAVVTRIKKLLPGAEVVTTKSLADQVTGSLGDAKKLASRLGGALGAIVLAAAFVIAMLLTLSSIAKRVREIGTLRAIGWSKARVVRQVLTETLAIGLLGGVIGIALGYVAAVAVGAFSPPLTGTTSGVPGFGSSSLSGFFGSSVATTVKTTTISLHAPVHAGTLVLGVAFAVLGGLLAGAVGGWRAARLSPAEALRNVG